MIPPKKLSRSKSPHKRSCYQWRYALNPALLEARSDETFLRGSEMSKLDVSKFEVSIRRELKGFNSPKKFIF